MYWHGVTWVWNALTSQLHPTIYHLYHAFNDKANRPGLFVDFVKNQGDMEKCDLLHKRKMVQQKINEHAYRPKTHNELLAKYAHLPDCEVYVKKIEDEAAKSGRVQKDRYMAHDKTKNRFWILDDEVLKLVNKQDTQEQWKSIRCCLTSYWT